MSEVIMCGSCCHDHNAPNGPTGCCDDHGPFMYFCPDCHDAWAAANPDRVEKIRRLAKSVRATPATEGDTQ